MKTIWKFPIELEDMVAIEVPHDAVFLHVDVQDRKVCLWAMVDSEAPVIKRHIRVIGTGLSADDVKYEQYIGSVLVLNGTYVFHIFDAGNVVQ